MSRLVPSGCPLSQRQYECLALLVDGLTQREVAEVLGISRETVKSHVLQAEWVLGVHNQRAAITAFYQAGWLRSGRVVRGWRDYSNERPAAA